jgi:hypothetical protein
MKPWNSYLIRIALGLAAMILFEAYIGQYLFLPKYWMMHQAELTVLNFERLNEARAHIEASKELRYIDDREIYASW